MPSSFSQRHGFAGPPPGTLIRHEVPVSFRRFLINLPHAHAGVEIHDVHEVVCNVLQMWPDKGLPPYYDYERHIKKCEWFRVYDIIEGLYRFLHGKDHYSPYPSAFVDAVNREFIEQNIGWQLVNGKVIIRGNEAFEQGVNTAAAQLEESRRPTAAGHIKSAIRALSERPAANTPGAVSHATSSVECLLNDITGEAMTLGRYLDKHPKLFHPALKKALDGVYGYASDAGARHGKEGVEPTFDEAQFAVTTCAAACTLLALTNPKGSI